jgi:aspartyl/asparaginyl-tRNA synthetase
MNEKYFNNLLLLFVITGTLLLLIYNYFSQPITLSLFQDNFSHLEKQVSISGNIKEINEKNNNLFFKICQYSKCIDVVYFNISKNNLFFIETNYLNNNSIKVIGKLIMYNDKLEIIASSLKEVDMDAT